MKRTADGDIMRKGPIQKPKLTRTKSRSFLVQDRGIKGERKVIDVNVTTNPTPGTGAFSTGSLLNGLSLGSDYNARIGRKIIMKKIMCRWSGVGTAGFPGNVRILVVYDKQANGAACANTDVLVSATFNAFNNLNNRDRFITLMDEITPTISTSDEAAAGIITRKISLETIFNSGNTGNVGDIQTGSIFYFLATQIGSGTIDFDAFFRIRFEDQ